MTSGEQVNMLISCFQCRQQLDVPEDSAGKRVRCPHCQYVIVVPSQAKPAAETPALALPSMDLDGDGDKAAPTTKVSPLPLPPVDAPPREPKWEQPASGPAAAEEYPELPSIDRGSARRPRPAPTSNVKWGRILGIGAVVGVIVIGIISLWASSQSKKKQLVFHNPQPQPPMQMPMQKKIPLGNNQGNPPGMMLNFPAPRVPIQAWRSVQYGERRFTVQFPEQPVQNQEQINDAVLTVFEATHGDWSFSVAHRAMTKLQFDQVALPDRYADILQHLRDRIGVNVIFPDFDIALAGGHPGHEWQLIMPDGRRVHVHTYFVRDGNTYHHYLLRAKAPLNMMEPQPAEFTRFFNSFSHASVHVIIEELDAMNNGARRDNEFTALALHPQQAVVVAGGVNSQLKVASELENVVPAAPFAFNVREGNPIEQARVSPDGRWLAIAVAGQIEYWEHWTDAGPQNKTVLPGLRCAYTKDQRLLVATKEAIQEFEASPHKLVSTLAVPDLAIQGFALSADEQTLAVFGAKAIAFYQWKEKKLLGKIDAHDAAVTVVAFAPDGKTLASASVDRTIKLWNVETRTATATLKQHAWTVWSLAFTPDGKHLASGGLDGMLLLWNVQPAAPQLVWAQAHQFPVRAVAFDGDGKHLYFTCKHPAGIAPGNKQYVRQLRKLAMNDMKANPQEVERIVVERAGLHLPSTSVVSFLSPDSKTFVTTTDPIDNWNQLRVWDTDTAKLRYTQPMQNLGVLSPDGKWFVYAKSGGFDQVQLLDVPAKQVTDTVLTYAGQGFPTILFAPDSKSFWMHRGHQFIRYEIHAPKEGGAPQVVPKTWIELKNANDALRVVTIHPSGDGKSFLVERALQNSLVKTRKLYSSTDGKELMPDAGAWSSFVRLRRDVGTEVELHDFLNGTSKSVGQQRQQLIRHPVTNANVLALESDRRYAATTHFAADGSVRVNLWDVQQRRPLLTWPDRQAKTASAVRFAPDGRYLLLVTNDSWTRMVPLDWLLERKALLPCPPNDVAAP